MAAKKIDITDSETLSELYDILAGAFAEGADLGLRETQIRAIGESLDVSLKYLRTALAGINIDPDREDISIYLDSISCLARLAVNYKSTEHDKDRLINSEPS